MKTTGLPTGTYALNFIPTCSSLDEEVSVMISGKEDAAIVSKILSRNGFAVKFEEEQEIDGELDWVELDPVEC